MAGLGATGAGGVVYGRYVEPYELDISKYEFVLSRLPVVFEGYKVIHISDVHLGHWMTLERMLDHVARINALQPDAVVITGDFVTYLRPEVPNEITTFLRALDAQDGVFACLGNHDHWTDSAIVSEAIRDGDANLLVNTNTFIEREGERLYFAGVDDVWEQQHDLERALADIEDNACILLLAHEPDFADDVAQGGRVSLQFSGHSHGGQVRLPIFGAPILPPYAKNYDSGAYTVDTLQLYVNRGLGLISPRIRINCMAEITEITLRSM